jgi:hypothetical protein
MAHKRSLRVVKWVGTVPAVGVCTFCATNFKVPLELMKRTSDAQATLQKQFEEHKCKREGASQAAAQGHGQLAEGAEWKKRNRAVHVGSFSHDPAGSGFNLRMAQFCGKQ